MIGEEGVTALGIVVVKIGGHLVPSVGQIAKERSVTLFNVFLFEV